jgi:hypothetical protein
MSADTVASRALSGENATASIWPRGEASCMTSCQLPVSISRTVPPPVRAARRRPSGETVTCQSPTFCPSVPQRTKAWLSGTSCFDNKSVSFRSPDPQVGGRGLVVSQRPATQA